MKFLQLPLIILATFSNVYSMENINPSNMNEINNNINPTFNIEQSQNQEIENQEIENQEIENQKIESQENEDQEIKNQEIENQKKNNNSVLRKKIKKKEVFEKSEKELQKEYNELEQELFGYFYDYNSYYTQINNECIKDIKENNPSYYDVIYSIEDIFDEIIKQINVLGEEDVLQHEPVLRKIELQDTIVFAKIFNKFCSTKEEKVIFKNIKRYIEINNKLQYCNTLQIDKFCDYICVQLTNLKSQAIKKISNSNNCNKVISSLDSTLHNFYNKLVKFLDLIYSKNKNNISNHNLKYPKDYFSNTAITVSLDNIESKIESRLNELQYYSNEIDQKFSEIHSNVIDILNKLKEEPNIRECTIDTIYNGNNSPYCLIYDLSELLKLSLGVNYEDKMQLKEFFEKRINSYLTYDFMDNLTKNINVLYEVVCEAAQTQFSIIHKVNYSDTIAYYYFIVSNILGNIYHSINSSSEKFSSAKLSVWKNLNIKNIDTLLEVQDKLLDFKIKFFPNSQSDTLKHSYVFI